MFLKDITFRNFRNYEFLHLQFSARVNLIAGENAQGKTNILEGIYFLSTAKSHRTNQDDELIQYGKSWFYLKGQIYSGSYNQPQDLDAGTMVSTVVEIINACGEKKRVKINNKAQEKISSVIGKINVVMFSPEDLSLIKGAPSERRRFLDILISRINLSYLHALQEYNLVLRQRNDLLKDIKDGRGHAGAFALDSWDALLVKAGSEVIRQRISVVFELSELAKEKHRQLTGAQAGEELSLDYQSQLPLGVSEFKGSRVQEFKGSRVSGSMELSLSEIEEVYEKHIRDSVDLDIRQGSTSVGPHRDDLIIAIGDVDARKFCSQGQQRTGVLSLKLANLEFVGRKLSEYPIVLLDDVTSELDRNRVAFLFDLLSRIPVQIFLTATSFDSFQGYCCSPLDFSDCELFVVEKGGVKKSSRVQRFKSSKIQEFKG